MAQVLVPRRPKGEPRQALFVLLQRQIFLEYIQQLGDLTSSAFEIIGSVTCIGRTVIAGVWGAGVDAGAGEDVTTVAFGVAAGTGTVPGFAGREGCKGAPTEMLTDEVSL